MGEANRRGEREREMEEEAVWWKKAWSLCNRLYNYLARQFTSQGSRLVDPHFRQPVVTVPVEDPPPDGSARTAGRSVPIGSKEEKEKEVNINERSQKYIQRTKEVLQSESSPATPPTK
uniref:Periplasmic nitrate reductase n=1 Tax=Anthurium amnicola TaxID=1678845 RepID=A0A1D1Z5T2_9ARAE